MSDDKQYDFEDTPDIEIGNNNVGMLLKVIAAVLIIICISYFVGYLLTKDKTPQAEEPPATQTQQTE